MIGEGIKRIPSYICKIPYDKLNELREKFWNSRKNYKRIWKAIRECCESDEGTAAILLEAAEMACVHEDLREVIVLGEPDHVFKVPNFCVCDPVFERRPPRRPGPARRGRDPSRRRSAPASRQPGRGRPRRQSARGSSCGCRSCPPR